MISRISNGSDSFLRRQGQLLNTVTETNDVSTKVILLQSMAYIHAFLITLSPPMARAIFSYDIIWLARLLVVLMPLQGLFNLIIYIGHRIYNYRRIHPDVTKFEVFCKLFIGKANDDVLFSRISEMVIDENEENMVVRVENENNDVEHIRIRLTDNNNNNDDNVEKCVIPGESRSHEYFDCHYDDLSSIHISDGKDEFSMNDFAFETSTNGRISNGSRSSIKKSLHSHVQNCDVSIDVVLATSNKDKSIG